MHLKKLKWSHAPVAQWIARPPPKGQVTGSTPVRGTIENIGEEFFQSKSSETLHGQIVRYEFYVDRN